MLLGNMLIVLLMACFGYGLGAIPFGLVLTRLAGLGDIRTIGSGNIGATNVLRTGNKPLAFATLLLDSGKGAIAIGGAALLVPLVSQDADTLHLAMLLAGIGAVLGHNYPIWLGFKGGKGVASTLGVILALNLGVGGIACATWLMAAVLWRYSSLAALIALGTAPIWAWVLGQTPLALALAFLAALAFYRHADNIRRLRAGTESKIGKKAAPPKNKGTAI